MVISLKIFDIWEMASRNYIQVASNKYKEEIRGKVIKIFWKTS